MGKKMEKAPATEVTINLLKASDYGIIYAFHTQPWNGKKTNRNNPFYFRYYFVVGEKGLSFKHGTETLIWQISQQCMLNMCSFIEL